MQKFARFTKEEDSLIKELLDKKQTISQIAEALGRTPASTEARIALKFGRRSSKKEVKWTDQEQTLLYDLVLKKTPRKEIAQLLNRTFPSVERAIRRLIFESEPNLARKIDNVSYEDVRKSFEGQGAFLLETSYTHDHIPLSFRCKEGHETSITWLSWKKTLKCPECRIESQKLTFEQVQTGFLQEGYTLLEEVYVNANTPLQYRCPQNHEHHVTWGNFYRGVRCPRCNKSTSKPEKELATYYDRLQPKIHDLTILTTHQLDLLFPVQKIAIEYCGLFWHSDYWPDKIPTYHYDKWKKCQEKGIRLITIFEDEWLNRKEACLSRINAALGINQTRIAARKCILKEVSQEIARDFLEANHLQGSSGREVALGLYEGERLVSVMTLGKPSRAHVSKDKKVLELKRLASLSNVIVMGGASKLFKRAVEYAKQQGYEEIRSYCDLRWGTGGIYKQLGFELRDVSKYTPHYTDFVKRWRNQSFAGNETKTEEEIASEKKVYRIYDCGHQTWSFQIAQ